MRSCSAVDSKRLVSTRLQEPTRMDGVNFTRIGAKNVSAFHVAGTTNLEETQTEKPVMEQNSSGPTCNACNASFSSADELRAHFHLDFHRYNVGRRLKKLEAVSEDEFERMEEADELSSIDGSDSDEEQVVKTKSPFVSFTTPSLPDQSIKIYRPVFSGQKDVDLDSVLDRLTALQVTGKPILWTLIMMSSGHFAGAVYNVSTEQTVLHKTFHRYTTRRKQGGAQGSSDQRGGKAKSAGAQLRRYNEQALAKEVKDLLETWKPQIDASDLIFLHAPSGNRQVFQDAGVFTLQDVRLRSFPFTTKRPTLLELTRCFKELICVKVGPMEKVEVKAVKAKPTVSSQPAPRPITPAPKLIPIEGEVEKIVGLVKRGKHELLETKLTPALMTTCNAALQETTDKEFSNTPTLLHFASSLDKPEVVSLLLQKGMDPCVVSSKNKTAYDLATEKDTRNAFRRYRADHEEDWDWKAAKVAEALTKEMEEEQERKLKEKKAKDREKAKEKAKKQKEKEPPAPAPVIEKMKPANPTMLRAIPPSARPSTMSVEARAKLEREKRAMAAEWRMRAATNKCISCARPLMGITPFERLSYKYCSMDCLKAHREFLDL